MYFNFLSYIVVYGTETNSITLYNENSTPFVPQEYALLFLFKSVLQEYALSSFRNYFLSNEVRHILHK